MIRIQLHILPGLLLLQLTAFPAYPEEPKDESQRCLALTLYWEARTEGRKGMIAVGSVVFNRIRSADFPDTVCSVVRQGGETPPCQFSYWCDGRIDVPPDDDETWQLARKVAREMLEDRPDDPTGSALFYHADYVSAAWASSMTRTAGIGSHIFYR